MINVTVTSDIDQLIKTLSDIAYNKDKIVRTVATTLRAEVARRIHQDGLAADGALISAAGYSDDYFEYRVEELNRLPDRKVILSATGQMENDFQVVDTPEGYGLGFLNEFNYNKSKWQEENYDRIIYDLTKEEVVLTEQTAEFETQRLIDAAP